MVGRPPSDFLSSDILSGFCFLCRRTSPAVSFNCSNNWLIRLLHTNTWRIFSNNTRGPYFFLLAASIHIFLLLYKTGRLVPAKEIRLAETPYIYYGQRHRVVDGARRSRHCGRNRTGRKISIFKTMTSARVRLERLADGIRQFVCDAAALLAKKKKNFFFS